MHRTLSFFPLLCIITCLLAGPATAQQPSGIGITADTLNSRISIGEIGTLFVKITGGDAKLPAELNAVGLTITHSGKQSKISIINNRQVITVTHIYRFHGEVPGTFNIPAIKAQIGRSHYQTNPIEITVYERDQHAKIEATKPYFGKLNLSKTTFYVNEVIPVSLTGYARGRNSINNVHPPKFSHESFIITRFSEINRQVIDHNGTYFTTATLPSSLFAIKAGDFRLGPATIGLQVVDSQRSNFGFSSLFSRTVNREMATNTVNVTVKPLPSGQPASFTGGVGNFGLSAKASTHEVSVGDPISMEFVVAGTGNLETLETPQFKADHNGNWKTYDASKEIRRRAEHPGLQSDQVVFSQVIIPERVVDHIPSFEMSFFDPDAEQYVTLESGSIPIKVRADTNTSTPTSITSSHTSSHAAHPAAVEQPTAQFQDILHIQTATPAWISTSSLMDQSPWFYAIQAIFSIAFFTILGFGVVRWFQSRQIHEQPEWAPTSYRKALKRIPKAGSPKRAFFQSVAAALELWKDENPDPPQPVQLVLNEVETRCETVLYSGTESSGELVTASEVDQVLPILHQLAKK